MVSVDPSAIRFFKEPDRETTDVRKIIRDAAPQRVFRRRQPTPNPSTKESGVTATASDAPDAEASDKTTEVTDASADNATAVTDESASAASADASSSDTSDTAEESAKDESSNVAEARKEEEDAGKLAVNDGLTPFYLPTWAAPWLFIPAYIEVNFSTCSAIYVRHPTARPGYSEIPTPYDADGDVIRFAWEYYAKRRPRLRTVSQLARMPEDRSYDPAPIELDRARRLHRSQTQKKAAAMSGVIL